MLKVKRWQLLLLSVLVIASMVFTVLPSPILFGGAGVASATDTTIQPCTADTKIKSDSGTTNYGTETTFALNDNSAATQRGLLKFSTASIPTGAVLTAATLSVYLSSYYLSIDAAKEIQCKRVTSAWTEAAVTWNTAPTVTDTGQVTGNTIHATTGWVDFGGAAMLALVQDAIGNRSNVLDVRLSFTTEASPTCIPLFWSKENGTESLGPKLVVTYTLPPTVATLPATSITATTATLNGNVTSLGDFGNVTQYGFVLSTTSVTNSPGNVSPSAQTTYTAGNWTWTGVQYPAGQTFNSAGNVTGLASCTTYYFRAAGYSTYGWAYGEEASFSIGILSIQPPTDDTRVNIDAPTTNYGNDISMFLRPGNGIIGTQRSLVSFSTSSIPDGVTISAATFSVYLVGYYLVDYPGLHVLCQRTTSAWAEGTVTWNTQPTATATNQAETTLPADPNWMSFDVLDLLNDEIADMDDKFSVLIRLETESGDDSIPYFATSEYATENLRPKLVVTYEYTPGVSNTPADKGLGIVLPNTYYWGKSGTQVGPSSWPLEDTDSIGNITNPTGFAINVLFSMSSMAGGITWNPGTTPGANVFVVKVGMSGVTNEAGMTKLSTTPQKLITNLPGGDHIHWEFVFYTPTNLITNNDSTEHTGYLTVAAEAY